MEEEEEEGGKVRWMRSFNEKARQQCWQKADVVAGRHPERWRKDPAGNIVCRKFTHCNGCLCHQYDHILPFSKGGESDAKNCQILQSRVNLYKSNKEDLAKEELEKYSCHIKFTEDGEKDFFNSSSKPSPWESYLITLIHNLHDDNTKLQAKLKKTTEVQYIEEEATIPPATTAQIRS